MAKQVTNPATVKQVTNPATPEVQERLLKLWNEKKEEEFRKEIVNLVTGHESYFKVMDLHSGSGTQQQVTRGEFVTYFKFCFQDELSNAIFSAISGGKESCTVVNVRVFFHGKRTNVKQKEVVKDAMWLWNTLQNLDLKDIDDDDNLKIEREELRNYFKGELDVALIDAIFDSIDTDGSGSITPMEYFRWRHNSKISQIQKIMHQAHKSLASPEEYVLHPIIESPPPPAQPLPLMNEDNFDLNSNPQEGAGEKVEEPKQPIEEPKVEEPKIEEPRVEEIKVEEPKVEEPKIEEIKVEEVKPVAAPEKEKEKEEEDEEEEEVVIISSTEGKQTNDDDIVPGEPETVVIAITTKTNPAPVSYIAQPTEVQAASKVQVNVPVAMEKAREEPVKNEPQMVISAQPLEEEPSPSLLSKHIWVLSAKGTNWRECEIVDEKHNEIKVHFVSYNPKFDEWVKKDSNRIRETRPQELQVGDNISAWYPRMNAWSEAEIEEIDKKNNQIKICYIGTPDSAYTTLNSSRISLVHKRGNDPFVAVPNEEFRFIRGTGPASPAAKKVQAFDGTTEPKAEEDDTEKQPAAARGCCQIM